MLDRSAVDVLLLFSSFSFLCCSLFVFVFWLLRVASSRRQSLFMYNSSDGKKNGGGGGGGAGGKRSSAAQAGAVSSSAQLGASTRARTDPKRTLGTANAVAAGVDLSRVGIMSDRELGWIRSLAYGSAVADAQEQQRAAEMARRKAASDTHRARWQDTTEARNEAFLRARQEEKDDAERRKVALDELYAEQKEEARLAKIAALELQRLKDDPRGRNAKSAVLLNEVIKARDEQMAFLESVKDAQSIENEQDRNAMLMDLWGYNAEELRKRLAARERNMAEKQFNLEMVLFQIQERKQQRADDKLDGLHAKAEAEDEARENALEEAERKQREREAGLYNEACAGPKLKKVDKLQQRLKENAEDMANQQRQEESLAKLKQSALEMRLKKQAQFEERKRIGLQLYEAEKATDSPKRRTQDRFEGKPDSMFNKMAEEDAIRFKATKEARRKQVEEEMAADAVEAASRRNKAEATASGFTSFAEEQAYLAEMRALPEIVRAEQAQEEAARMAEAKRVEEIQKMQAAERRERKRREVETERDNARRQRDYQVEEDRKYREFLETQLPKDMNPILRAKAMQLE